MVTNMTGANETELVETKERHDALGDGARRRSVGLSWWRRFRSSGLTQTAFAQRKGCRYVKEMLTRLPVMTNQDGRRPRLPG